MLMLTLGLLMVVIGGEFVAFRRYVDTPLPTLFWWAHTALLGSFIGWSQWRSWRHALREDDPGASPSLRSGYRQTMPEFLLAMAFALSLAGLYGLRQLVWAAPAVALVGLVFCWLAGRFRARSYPLAAIGWLAAGAVGLLLPWPNEQRHGAVEFLGGLAMVLQSGWEMTWQSGTTAA